MARLRSPRRWLSLLLLWGSARAACEGEEALEGCLKLLSGQGLSALGGARELVRNCGDENPPLLFLSNHNWLPDGKVRHTLEARFPSTLAALKAMTKAYAIAQNHSERVWMLAVEYAYSCIDSQMEMCMPDKSLRVRLRDAHSYFLGEMSGHLTELATASASALWVPGVGEPAHVVAGHAFRGHHMEFTSNVISGLGIMETGATIKVLHDLSTRLAKGGCEMLAELLAHFTLAKMPRPGALPISDPGFPRFEFRAGSCCRRYHVLADLIDTLVEGPEPIRMVEVGVNNAITSEYLLDRHHNLQLHGVDPWVGVEAIQAEAEIRLLRFGPRAQLLRATSKEAASQFEPRSFDFVFIDGDHSHEAVLADLQLWRPLVRPGGVVAGHDLFNPAYEGVLDAILEHLRPEASEVEPPTVHFGPDFTWWFEV